MAINLAQMVKQETQEEKRKRARTISERLAGSYPEIKVPLHHRNAYELLVATILSAQCTDEMVNRVTPALFRLYPDPKRLARARQRDIERLIRPLGLFHAKSRALKQCAERLFEKHGGEVPARMEELTQLPGVGRKTANVILGHAFGIPGIVVDTHFKRLSRRLALTNQENPDKIEKDLMEILQPEDWSAFSHRLILHGRKVCHARKPACHDCVLNDLCPSADLEGAQAKDHQIAPPL